METTHLKKGFPLVAIDVRKEGGVTRIQQIWVRCLLPHLSEGLERRKDKDKDHVDRGRLNCRQSPNKGVFICRRQSPPGVCSSKAAAGEVAQFLSY